MLTFENFSNRCWFNAAVQAILHVPQISNLMRDDIFPRILVKKRKNSSDFAVELSRIAQEYWSTFQYEKVVNLDALFEIFVKPVVGAVISIRIVWGVVQNCVYDHAALLAYIARRQRVKNVILACSAVASSGLYLRADRHEHG